MLPHRKYVLIIDDAPRDKRLDDYFNKFDFTIVQEPYLPETGEQTQAPEAILISERFIRSNSVNIAELYQHYNGPLLVISDNYDEDTCVKMLEAGADDFLIKPVHPRELHARISAIGRRVQRARKEQEPEKEVLLFANWRLYPSSRQVFDEQNKELSLSAGEYDLLLAFARQPQRILGREFLLQITKNSELNPFDRRIDVQISRLRQKIETDAKKPALIKTIRNGGYLFTARVIAIKEGTETNLPYEK
ncbi:response regulator transcription factor [Legionella spiritensis]|uniref:DNA-binding response regulator n=1 Tax=Legionella spiritensis TaxID=452 RepID=A0A0W0Z080_LEGSP|nr:response regulator transcription factor [Legionella spiritensis]KTD62519.1 DNA-binding response regulator [Legionella spiritensis]SNV30846.1 DNA-binding response regulator [Legionella spiritensis]VEG92000.1 DNA-binding response regulator [Legionella spiritensis]